MNLVSLTPPTPSHKKEGPGDPTLFLAQNPVLANQCMPMSVRDSYCLATECFLYDWCDLIMHYMSHASSVFIFLQQ